MSILIDNGATHSFVDPKIVKQFELTIEPLHKVMKVRVANRQLMPCSYNCPEFTWTMGAESFTFNMVLLKVGRSDIILGMDWVDFVRPIILHTRPRSISFFKDHRLITIIGSDTEVLLAEGNARSIANLLRMGQDCLSAHLLGMDGGRERQLSEGPIQKLIE